MWPHTACINTDCGARLQTAAITAQSPQWNAKECLNARWTGLPWSFASPSSQVLAWQTLRGSEPEKLFFLPTDLQSISKYPQSSEFAQAHWLRGNSISLHAWLGASVPGFPAGTFHVVGKNSLWYYGDPWWLIHQDLIPQVHHYLISFDSCNRVCTCGVECAKWCFPKTALRKAL